VNWLARSLVLLAVFRLAMVAEPAVADTLADIKARGEVVIGTKSDYPPYGFKDSDGQIVGIEPDLAADLAKRLGVRLRIEPVFSSNRIQMLQEGKIDLLIATLGITEERRAVVTFIDPAYYASGIAGLVLPQAGIQSEADLKDKSVCAIKGNFFNKDLQTLYVQKELMIVKDVPEAEQAPLADFCTAAYTAFCRRTSARCARTCSSSLPATAALLCRLPVIARHRVRCLNGVGGRA